jgi:radical SAM superfamily enzyme YgiQ (UPF0313 family)
VIRRNSARPLMPDIHQLPLPARHLLPAGHVVLPDRLAGTDLRMAHVMFSRGCPFPCSFCAAGQTRIQYRSGASARFGLEHLIAAYGIEGFAIVDDNFIVNKTKVGDICDHIAGLGLRWSALSRVDTIDGPLLAKMAASGCIEVKYGMESGSERLLKAMRKNTRRDQIRSAVHATVDAGIAAKVFVIHGFPGEDDQSTDDTISLLTELAPDLVRVSLFRFVPTARHPGLRQPRRLRSDRHAPATRLGRGLVRIPHPPQHPPLVGHRHRVGNSPVFIPAAARLRRSHLGIAALTGPPISPRLMPGASTPATLPQWPH